MWKNIPATAVIHAPPPQSITLQVETIVRLSTSVAEFQVPPPRITNDRTRLNISFITQYGSHIKAENEIKKTHK